MPAARHSACMMCLDSCTVWLPYISKLRCPAVALTTLAATGSSALLPEHNHPFLPYCTQAERYYWRASKPCWVFVCGGRKTRALQTR
jgi:hypothetical protein